MLIRWGWGNCHFLIGLIGRLEERAFCVGFLLREVRKELGGPKAADEGEGVVGEAERGTGFADSGPVILCGERGVDVFERFFGSYGIARPGSRRCGEWSVCDDGSDEEAIFLERGLVHEVVHETGLFACAKKVERVCGEAKRGRVCGKVLGECCEVCGCVTCFLRIVMHGSGLSTGLGSWLSFRATG